MWRTKANSRVLEYNNPLTNTTADTVFGQGGDFTFAACDYDTGGEGKPSSANDLCSPSGVAVDGSGDLYVADTLNNRLLEYDQPLAVPSPTPTPSATATMTATATPTASATATTTTAPTVTPTPAPAPRSGPRRAR